MNREDFLRYAYDKTMQSKDTKRKYEALVYIASVLVSEYDYCPECDGAGYVMVVVDEMDHIFNSTYSGMVRVDCEVCKK